MFENPFVPVFGGKPDFFFGRKELLNRFTFALVDRGSEDRALFITGNRGCCNSRGILQDKRSIVVWPSS